MSEETREYNFESSLTEEVTLEEAKVLIDKARQEIMECVDKNFKKLEKFGIFIDKVDVNLIEIPEMNNPIQRKLVEGVSFMVQLG